MHCQTWLTAIIEVLLCPLSLAKELFNIKCKFNDLKILRCLCLERFGIFCLPCLISHYCLPEFTPFIVIHSAAVCIYQKNLRTTSSPGFSRSSSCIAVVLFYHIPSKFLLPWVSLTVQKLCHLLTFFSLRRAYYSCEQTSQVKKHNHHNLLSHYSG